MKAIEGQITWVYCNDLAKTCAFYETTLGLPLWRDAGAARIYRTAPGARIGVCRTFENRVIEPAGSMITLLTEDVDGWYERLKLSGAEICGAPSKQEKFGIYSFFCKDPNGYLIEFQRFLDS